MSAEGLSQAPQDMRLIESQQQFSGQVYEAVGGGSTALLEKPNNLIEGVPSNDTLRQMYGTQTDTVKPIFEQPEAKNQKESLSYRTGKFVGKLLGKAGYFGTVGAAAQTIATHQNASDQGAAEQSQQDLAMIEEMRSAPTKEAPATFKTILAPDEFEPLVPNEPASPEEYGFSSDHTLTAKELARMKNVLKDELFAGREIITRHTYPIDGKVDIRSWVGGAEAIVVDSKKYPEAYDRLYAKMVGVLGSFYRTQPQDADPLRNTLGAIFETVRQTINYDKEYVDKYSDELAQKAPTHRKVELSEYLNKGKGVCRHMALAEVWLGGAMEERGLLPKGGIFTAEVNQSTKGWGAHEWARYTAPNGEVYILDVAQNFFGTLEEAAARSEGSQKTWEYFLDEAEKKAFMAKMKSKNADTVPRNVLPKATDNPVWWDESYRSDGTMPRQRLIKIDPPAPYPVEPKPQVIIDGTPKTTEDFKAIEEQRRIERNAPYEARIQEIEQQLANLKTGLSERDISELNSYAFNLANKREAQNMGNGKNSYYFEGEAGKAYRAMSQRAKEIASNYNYLWQQRASIYSRMQ